jgi:hypothetical protein
MNPRFMLKFAFLACMVLLTGCPGPNNTQPEVPPGMTGFYLQTWVTDFTIPTSSREPFVFVNGIWNHNIESNPGSKVSFQNQTDSTGLDVVLRAAPATWLIEWILDEGPSLHGNDCDNLSNYFDSAQYQEMDVTCVIFSSSVNVAGAAPTFTFSPEPVYRNAPPSVGTISGGNAGSLVTTYGMPLIQYYDTSGTLQAQENASYVSPDGTGMQIPAFSISSLTAGFYIGYIYNKNASGNYISAGVVQTDLATTEPIYRYFYLNGHYYTSANPPICCYEGISYHVFTAQIEDTEPWYMLYDPGITKYFYTANYNEMYNLVNVYGGWQYLGILGYVAHNQIGGTVPLYRSVNSAGDHLFTTSWAETVQAVQVYGYTYEGIADYVATQ